MPYAADATGLFYLGTRPDLAPRDLLAPGFAFNHADRKLSVASSKQAARLLHECEESIPGGGPRGLQLVRFRTSFANKPDATETLALDREDGEWKVTGYIIE